VPSDLDLFCQAVILRLSSSLNQTFFTVLSSQSLMFLVLIRVFFGSVPPARHSAGTTSSFFCFGFAGMACEAPDHSDFRTADVDCFGAPDGFGDFDVLGDFCDDFVDPGDFLGSFFSSCGSSSSCCELPKCGTCSVC